MSMLFYKLASEFTKFHFPNWFQTHTRSATDSHQLAIRPQDLFCLLIQTYQPNINTRAAPRLQKLVVLTVLQNPCEFGPLGGGSRNWLLLIFLIFTLNFNDFLLRLNFFRKLLYFPGSQFWSGLNISKSQDVTLYKINELEILQINNYWFSY